MQIIVDLFQFSDVTRITFKVNVINGQLAIAKSYS